MADRTDKTLEKLKGTKLPPSGTKVSVFTVGSKVHRLQKTRIVIGSVVSADVRLSGEGISPIQAVIEISDSGNVVYDLASITGVYVNGQKAVTHKLKSGDTLKIGAHEIKFKQESVEEAVKTTRFSESGSGRKLFMSPEEDLKPILFEDSGRIEDIFDYRPSAKPALEVVMSWMATILDVEHYSEKNSVNLGTSMKSDFGIPPLLSASEFQMASMDGPGSYTIYLDSKMKGVIQSNGELKNVEEILATTAGSRAIKFGANDFAKLTVGDIDFYLSYTASPPKLKKRSFIEKDVFFYKIMVSSAILTAAIFFAILNIDIPKNLEVEELPEQVTTVIYQPEKYKLQEIRKPKPVVEEKKVEEVKPPEPPKPTATPTPKQTMKVDLEKLKTKPKPAKTIKMAQPKPVPQKNAQVADKAQKQARQAENMGNEGAGARAKGQEGTRGKPNAKPSQTNQDKAKRPSPTGGEGRGGGDSQVRGEGNLDVLKGATSTIQNLLGNSAEKLGGGGKKLEGFGGFDTQGKGGLALSGSGSGGGGDAASLGGLTDHGRGGGRVGTGLGAAGKGDGIIGGKSRVSLQTGGAEETVVMGAIDADAIEAALLAHKDEFRLCYEREINAGSPNIDGRVGTSFVIGPSGRVTTAGVLSSSLNNRNTENCILNVIKRIDFPKPEGGGIVQVRYPFKFRKFGS